MSNFVINNNSNNKNRTIKNNFIGRQNTLTSRILSPNTFVINASPSSSKNLITQIDGTRAKPEPSTIQGSNYAKIIRIRKDTKPIRNNLYDYINSVFKRPVLVDVFQFCAEQKISTVFSTHGNTQWFSTLINKEPSYKTALFNKVFFNPLSLREDCSCNIFDFNGRYEIDRRLPDFNSLISSSNKDISRVSFEFEPSTNYIMISFYSHKTKSYVRVRLRPPLRYRPIYGDWVFDENVTIDNIMSSTEYAEIVDCCQPIQEGSI